MTSSNYKILDRLKDSFGKDRYQMLILIIAEQVFNILKVLREYKLHRGCEN